MDILIRYMGAEVGLYTSSWERWETYIIGLTQRRKEVARRERAKSKEKGKGS
jgi:hypothetical protein